MSVSQKLEQEFSILIFQLFRTAGFTMNIQQTEQLRGISDKIVATIEEVAKVKAVELIRKMQTAVGEGFTSIGKDVEAIEKRLDELEDGPVAPVPPKPESL